VDDSSPTITRHFVVDGGFAGYGFAQAREDAFLGLFETLIKRFFFVL
jgi:hypothetical protein